MNKKNKPNIPNQSKYSGPQKLGEAMPEGKVYDSMVVGREYESLVKLKPQFDVMPEFRIALNEISKIRKKPTICYFANVVNGTLTGSISIDAQDDLPFAEMLSSIPEENKEIDILLVTPGGLAYQIDKFVDKLRPRFSNVSFILPNVAMSAGTIFVMSGDEIVMDSRAYIGPIDPQVRNKDGVFVPAQSILTLIKDIQDRGEPFVKKGQNPPWTDLQILNKLDHKEIGNAINASNYSVELVENYLKEHKFKSWERHKDGKEVSLDEKKETAQRIAKMLCDHSIWKNHSRGITRETAWSVCKLKITHPETIPGLDVAIRKFWALVYWVFENTKISKIFLAENYAIFRQERVSLNQQK